MPVGVESATVMQGAIRTCVAMTLWAALLSVSPIVAAQATPAAPTAPVTGVEAPPANDSNDAAQPSEAAPVPEAPRARVVLVSTQAIGIDPVVGRFVNEQLAVSATQLGYDVVQGEETVRFAQQVTLPYPPAPGDLWRLTYASHSQRGVFARVWAEAGQYVSEVLVASLDGTGPFVQRATSGAQDLQATIHNLLLQTLPPPSAQLSAPPPSNTTATPSVASDAPDSSATADTNPPPPSFVPGLPDLPADTAPRLEHHWNLALQTEAAVGLGGNSFYNHLLGARLDYRFTHDVQLGVYLGYANLRGRSQRVNNALMYLQFEDRVAVSSASPVSIPLRAGLGYVPRNGVVMRLATGIFYAVTPTISVGTEVLAPTFWMIRDRILFSMDFAVEVDIKL